MRVCMGEYYNILQTPAQEQYRLLKGSSTGAVTDYVTDSKGDMLRHHNPKDPTRCLKCDWTVVDKGVDKRGEAPHSI